jgi:hypothetical protein
MELEIKHSLVISYLFNSIPGLSSITFNDGHFMIHKKSANRLNRVRGRISSGVSY